MTQSENPSEMMVTWVTMNSTKTPKVEYNLIGEENFCLHSVGFSSVFVDGGNEKADNVHESSTVEKSTTWTGLR